MGRPVRIEQIEETEFNRHPARYINRVYLTGICIHVMRGGIVRAVLQSHARNAALRVKAARGDVAAEKAARG